MENSVNLKISVDVEDELDEIIPPSQSILKLLEVTSDEDYSMKSIVKVISEDAHLTAEILKIINSAAYSLSNQIDSLHTAITLLGERIVFSLAMRLGTNLGENLCGYFCEEHGLWKHSLRTAISAKLLAPYARKTVNVDVAYTGGLLHDLGKSVVSKKIEELHTKEAVTEKYQQYQDEKKSCFLKFEESLVGFNHSGAGHYLAKEWGFPESLVQVISYYHYPELSDEEHKSLVFCVHMADFVASMTGGSTGIDSMSYELSTNYKQYFDLKASDLERVAFELERQFKKVYKN
ncbi:MAG: HDOD domain-containing protein [Candidatus Cloacimonetes bacterium]|nr:HDOD domain-containing protein [Candidatus Cloacimonadota bacterium]